MGRGWVGEMAAPWNRRKEPDDMGVEGAARWALRSAAGDLAATFEKRRLDRPNNGNLVNENMADLSAAGIVSLDSPDGPEGRLAESVELLRIVASGCGSTAFALAAALTNRAPSAARQEWGHSCDSAVFLGLAERSFQIAVQCTKDRSGDGVTGPARLPGTQFAVARMRADLATMTALLTRYVNQRAEPDAGAVSVGEGVEDSCIPRYYLATVAERVVSAAFQLTEDSDPQDRQRICWIWQDVKVGPVFAFTNDHALELIGKAALGIDPNDRPRWL